MSERRDSSVSETSSTLSEFVRRRYAGEVPIFGGDPRTGAAEFSSSLSTTVNTQLVSALTGINETLRRLDLRGQVSALRTPPRPVRIRNMDPSEDELREAAELDDDKIRLLLDASLVDVRDTAKYFALLSVARESIKKKQAATEVSRMRKAAALRQDFIVTDDEVEAAHGSNLSEVDLFAERLGFVDDVGKRLVRRALVHESRFAGRATNRALALVGDAALAMLLKEHAFDMQVSVGDTSGLLQATQNNAVLRDLGVKIKLDAYICSGVNIDTGSRSVMATAVEAVYGAAYMHGGMEFVRKLNKEDIVVCDFTRMFTK